MQMNAVYLYLEEILINGLHIGDYAVENTKEEKLLGVVIDKKSRLTHI